ncbi:SpoIIE family protein phosphatase [Desulfobacterales bacterium HSG2]|nr:SpoIIE family protein phosphatase [Desulfobacterales bacterium HSG2]
MIDEPTLSDFFHVLDMAVMERMDDGSFQLIGGLPDCLKHFFPETLWGEKGFRPDEKFPFLENFLFDAEDCWADGSTEKLKSGPWTETDLLGNDYEFEAVAVSAGKRKLLLIEPARYSYEEKQSVIQKSRELSLAYHRLEQAEAELKKAKETAESANRKIISSIQYAKMIQRSLLPNPENIMSFLPDSFFIWKPRDIVGGDFIFMDYVAGGLIIAVIDCTGHGVPGAFMTMIVSFGLRKIIKDEGYHDPARILKRLSFIVKTTLQQDTNYALSDDGLDAAVCFISGQSSVVSSQLPRTTDNPQRTTNNPQLTFAGARLPLFYFYDDEVTVIKGDRQSIGYKKSDVKFDFTNHTVRIRNGISFYMASDGFMDQLDREDRRRFGTRRFRNLIKRYARLPFEKQRDIFLRTFHEHKGENEVQDDVTLVGWRLTVDG